MGRRKGGGDRRADGRQIDRHPVGQTGDSLYRAVVAGEKIPNEDEARQLGLKWPLSKRWWRGLLNERMAILFDMATPIIIKPTVIK